MDDVILDAFNAEEVERRYLLSKPPCFLVLGKQGCGKSTLAKRFARTWKCILVTPSIVIEEALQEQSKLGLQANNFLMRGTAVPDVIVLKLVEEKLNSEEVKHHGYILDGFPLLVPDGKVIQMQLDFIKNLPLKPDFLIYLKIPDHDLLLRRVGFKVDPKTNNIHPRAFYDPDAVARKSKVVTEEEEEEEEAGEEDEEEEREEIEDEDLYEDLDFEESIEDIIDRLLVRRDDSSENIMKNVNDFKEHILEKMEDYLGSHNQRKVIELDASLTSKDIFKNLLSCLTSSLLNGTRTPFRLQGKEDQEEIGEDIDTEDMLRTLAATENIAPGFRWRRSKWGRLCPVALYEGQNVMGNPLFAVSFLDKMYVMSNAEALDKFMKNPRKYLLPPQPAPPCKVVVLGPPHSGCTTLSKKLAERYNAKVLNVAELMQPIIEQQKRKLVEQGKKELIQNSIKNVKDEIEAIKRTKLETMNADSDSDSEKEKQEEEVEEIVDENHPQVKRLVEASMADVEGVNVTISPEQHVECLENAMTLMYAGSDKVPSSGGWILDNFPTSRDQFTILVDRGIMPDKVIALKDDSNESDILIKRAEENGHFKMEGSEEVDPAKLQSFKETVVEVEQSLTGLQTAMRNAHNMDPLSISCDETLDDAFTMCVKDIEAAFQYRGWEYTGMDQDEEEEDFNAIIEEELDEDEDEDPTLLRKPFGETLQFCPVMFKENNVLAPGSSDFAVKYREKVYFLASEEHRQKFLDNSEYYLPQSAPFKLPPVRLLLHGVKGSGKTLHGRFLAKKYGIFHISFKDRLQELILHKTLKKIGPHFDISDEERDPKDTDYTETGDEENEENEAILQLTEFEENIRNNILSGEELTKETLDAILIPWWKEEPYKSTGFILEGFPRTVEELKYMTSSGLFPDGSILLTVEGETICDRLFPPIFDRFKVARDKRIKLRNEKKEEMLKQREEARKLKKEERLAEIEERKAEMAAARSDSDEEEETEEEEEDYDIDEAIEMELIDEFGEEEFDEDEEETDEDATERIRDDLLNKFEEETINLDLVQEALDDESIPRLPVDGGRKPRITQYVLMKLLKPQIMHRDSLFDKCQSISQSLALKLLNQGYKHPSRFGRWCPVKLYEKDVLPPFVSKDNQIFPVIYREYIYFLSSEENKERFLLSPRTYICGASTKQLVPMKIMILGPPKSGKTTLANRFVKEYGLVRLSAGEIVRKILATHSKTKLVQDINDFLKRGLTVPDELTIQALETCLLDPQCVTRGFVLDDFPVTYKQVELLSERRIIPYKVIVMELSDKELMERAAADQQSPNRTQPIHDSFTITAIRVASHRKDSLRVLEFYQEKHRNVFRMDATESKWLMYHKATNEVRKAVDQIQTYITNILLDKAVPIKHMCVTPEEFKTHLGEFEEYCSVSLDQSSELVDCSADTTNDLVALYRGKYYKFVNEENLAKFIALPSKYTPPLAVSKLPYDLPVRRSATFVKQAFPKQLELKGYCPVTYLTGKLRYEAIVPGEHDLIAEYQEKLYSFATEENLQKFLRRPKKYSSLTLPSKLPPRRDPVNVVGLPMLGYMEQTVATAIIKAMTSVGCTKPKHPFLTAKRSALLYLAYHLKAHNPKASQHVRSKYKKLLATFEDNCGLIDYLRNNMGKRYVDPTERPIDFDLKLDSFLSLQQSVPT